MNNRSAADAQFDLAFSHMDLGVFNVWKEKNFGTFGNLNFITGAGVLTFSLQSCAIVLTGGTSLAIS